MGGKENYIYQLTNKSCFSRWGNLNPLLPFESLQILNHHHQHHHHHGGKHSFRRYSFRAFFCNSFNSQISQCSTFSGFVLVCWSWFFCSVSCFVYIFRVLCVKVLWFSQWKEIQKKKKIYKIPPISPFILTWQPCSLVLQYRLLQKCTVWFRFLFICHQRFCCTFLQDVHEAFVLWSLL